MKKFIIDMSKMPEFDGQYLCFISELEKFGNVIEYYKVVECQNNIWLVSVFQRVIAWKELYEHPFLENEKTECLLDTLSGLVNDVGTLLSDEGIEWQQAGYFNHAKIFLSDLRNND